MSKRPDEPSSIVLSGRILPGGTAASQQVQLTDDFRSRYSIGQMLGEGGCGKAFRAEDRKLSRPVAIKFLVRHDDPKQAERFLREGKLLARITDRHVVRIYDLELISGHPCLVMELVDGGSLRELLAEGRPPLDRALEIAWMTLKGLAACHAAGVVHRDLKPDNVLLTREGIVKIADLGVARYADAVSQLTKSGELLGTPRYMAPEQLAGEATISTDLHAMGSIMFEMLSGRRAYEAQNLPQLFHMLTYGAVPDLREVLPSVPAPVAELVRSAMSRDPALRPASALEMAAQVRQLMSGELGSGTLERPAPTPVSQKVPRPATPAPGVTIVHAADAAQATRSGSSGAVKATTQLPVGLLAGAAAGASGAGGAASSGAGSGGAVSGAATWTGAQGPMIAAFMFALGVSGVALWPRAGSPPPAPIPAPAPSAAAAAGSASSWQDVQLWSVHAELQQLAFLQKFRRDDWSTLHEFITPGSWDMVKGEKALKQLQASAATDARAQAVLHATLRGLPAATHGGPFEQVLQARLYGLGFVSQFIQERLDHYHRELPHDDVLDPDVMARVDDHTFSEGLRMLLARFATEYPLALAAAVQAGDDARDLPGVMLSDIARVSEWLQSAGRGGQSAPQVVSAVAELQRRLIAPPPDERCARAYAIAAASWQWGKVGAGTTTSRTALRDACAKLIELERDLPRSRLSLEAHRKVLEQSLALFEKKP